MVTSEIKYSRSMDLRHKPAKCSIREGRLVCARRAGNSRSHCLKLTSSLLSLWPPSAWAGRALLEQRCFSVPSLPSRMEGGTPLRRVSRLHPNHARFGPCGVFARPHLSICSCPSPTFRR